ncbi:glucosamine--fructose-6-phosphate aminotransferase (isomerizing) [Streptomyces sp. DvalAA-14]|uniref:SIS domain-containing protein n=1 Tax=unclassified Streptomyces TaxID=2593676 RepID=UPI00081BAF82|nr:MULTISPECIES: SIS domain-containing protein [unclassified Streptomyces]MYS21098.1 SIS domain-containing protein [Streptomyces sp. SID4948]SCD84049.1 glucosamine--fructose-6-phosphate aminotransferase (isomerizing) [Streptomyces sp. DvalAA-14]
MSEGYLAYAAARSTQAEELGAAIARLSGSVGSLAAAGRLSGPGPVFVGIGASLAAACAPVWSLRSRGIHSWRLGAGDHPLPFPVSRHPVFGVSQSGRSAETLAVLESVDPALRHAVVNMIPSPIAEAATGLLDLGSIPDSYASTIGFTATVAALGMLADAWDGGTVDGGWAGLGAAFATAEKELTEQVRALAPLFASAGSADFVGAGPAVGSAEAGALLFREVARIPSTAMSTRQYLHGAMESAGGGVHVVFGDAREHAVAGTLAAAGHPVILVTGEPVEDGPLLHPVRVPRMPAAQRAVIEILVAQILVEAVAEVRGVQVEEFVFHNSDIKVTAERPAV